MDDLVSWLRQQIDEDEASLTAPHRLSNEYCSDGAHWTDERVLAECEAKRRIIQMHPPGPLHNGLDGPTRLCQSCEFAEHPCSTLKQLALPYAGRPGYQESWRPA